MDLNSMVQPILKRSLYAQLNKWIFFYSRENYPISWRSRKAISTYLELYPLNEMQRTASGLNMHMYIQHTHIHMRIHIFLALAYSFSLLKGSYHYTFFFWMISRGISYVFMNKYCQFPHGYCVFFFLFFCSSLYLLGALV